MTTHVTTTEQDTGGGPGLIATAALTLVTIAGMAFWVLRPAANSAVPVPNTAISMTNDGVAPMGVLVPHSPEQHRERAAREAAAITTRGGVAELSTEQEAEARARAWPAEQGAVSDQEMFDAVTAARLALAEEAMVDQALFDAVTAARLATAGATMRTVPANRAMTVYLTGSAPAAEEVRRRLMEDAAGRLQRGEPALQNEIVVVGQSEEDAIWLMLQELDTMRHLLGLSGMAVVDLRPGSVTGE